jgi:hypothetical protein
MAATRICGPRATMRALNVAGSKLALHRHEQAHDQLQAAEVPPLHANVPSEIANHQRTKRVICIGKDVGLSPGTFTIET